MNETRLPVLPIQFEKFDRCTDLASLLKRIRHRVGELQGLMPMLEGEYDDSAREIGELKTTVLKDFQRMVSLLDRAGKGKLPDDFAEWEEKLDAIDQSLETAFNRVGQLAHDVEPRGV